MRQPPHQLAIQIDTGDSGAYTIGIFILESVQYFMLQLGAGFDRVHALQRALYTEAKPARRPIVAGVHCGHHPSTLTFPSTMTHSPSPA